jgi:hypothetical protein
VPFCTASSVCSPGTISPAANGWIWNLPSVASETYFAKLSQEPHSVSSDFGQLAVSRHFSSGIDCAMAGAATADAARPRPAVLMNCRRFMAISPSVAQYRAEVLGTPREIPRRDLGSGNNVTHQIAVRK